MKHKHTIIAFLLGWLLALLVSPQMFMGKLRKSQ